jgi:chitodextrinase
MEEGSDMGTHPRSCWDAAGRITSWRRAGEAARHYLWPGARRSAALVVIAVLGLAVAGALAATSAKASQAEQASTRGVTVVGDQFYLNGRPFVPHGLNSVSQLNSSWCTAKSTAAAAANYGHAEIAAAKDTWHANTLRFQVSQPVLAGPNGAAYAQQVQTNVQQALNAGLVVIISMQDESLACGPAEPLPSQETETAWNTLLANTTLGDNPYVMFELFNEPQNLATNTPTTDPQQSTWVDWEDGGRQLQPTSSDNWTAYTPVGYQDLVNYVRGLNYSNPLIADGAHYAGQLQGVPILTDPGPSYQIAYAVHPFYYTDGQSSWDNRWGYLTSSHAVIATAWNYKASACGTSAESMAPQFLSYMRNTVNVGIIGHSLDVFQGQLMADPSLTPTQCGTSSPGGGQDFLSDYMDTFTGPPQTPTNLAANATSATEIDLTWDAASDPTVLGYDVFRNGVLIGTSTDPSFSDTGLSPTSTYSYTIDAYDSQGNISAESASVAATTPADTTPPTVPTGLSGTVGAQEIDLGWQPSSDDVGVTGYDIYRNGTKIASTTSTTYADSSVRQGRTYKYRVDAYDAAGNVSAKTAPLSVTYPDTTAPSAPTNLRLTPGYKRIALSWSASVDNVGIVGYYVYRNGNKIATVSGTSYTNTGLVSGTTYSYYVTAYDGAGNESIPSATVSAKAK